MIIGVPPSAGPRVARWHERLFGSDVVEEFSTAY
jgi:hypothetical protein